MIINVQWRWLRRKSFTQKFTDLWQKVFQTTNILKLQDEKKVCAILLNHLGVAVKSLLII